MCTPARIITNFPLNGKVAGLINNPNNFGSSASSPSSSSAVPPFATTNFNPPTTSFLIPNRMEFENTTEIARPLNSKGGLLASEVCKIM